MIGRRIVLAAAAGCALAACAAAPTPAPANGARPARQPTAADEEPSPRPADADADVAYYNERTAALASEALIEVARTDFTRMRRGRLYANAAPGREAAGAFEGTLNEAFKTSDHATIVDVTGKMLSANQADIRAHMLRAVALRRLGRDKEANFHREAAIGLIESIVRTGDGRSFATAWTVFQVEEEYEVAKSGGYVVTSQSLTRQGGRWFDVLEVQKPDGSARFRAHYDITEVFAEDGRKLRARLRAR